MTTPAPFRYEPIPPPQPACTGCWRAAATVRVWQGRYARAALCDACTGKHRRAHRAVQGELFHEEGRT